MAASTSQSDSSGRNAFRNVALAVTLMLLLTPLRFLAILLIAFIAAVFLLKLAYAANRNLGISLMAIVGLVTACYLLMHYSANEDYKRLLAKLDTHDDVTIRRELFPIPKISQLSIGEGVSHIELEAILEMNELAEISELYLDNSELTNASLAMVGAKLNLNYIFIDCAKITDVAILGFEKQFPHCTVIPHKRVLRDDGVEVFLGPPPIDE